MAPGGARQRDAAVKIICAAWGVDRAALSDTCAEFLGWCGAGIAHAEAELLGPCGVAGAGEHVRERYDARFIQEFIASGVAGAKGFAQRLPALRKEIAEVLLRRDGGGVDDDQDTVALLLVFLEDQWSATRKLAAAAIPALLPATTAGGALARAVAARLSSPDWWVVDGAVLALQRICGAPVSSTPHAGVPHCLPVLPSLSVGGVDVALCEEAAAAVGIASFSSSLPGAPAAGSTRAGAGGGGRVVVSEELTRVLTALLAHPQESVRLAAVRILATLARNSAPLAAIRLLMLLVTQCAALGEGAYLALQRLLPILPARCVACIYDAAWAGLGNALSTVRQAAAETTAAAIHHGGHTLAMRFAHDAAGLPAPTPAAWAHTEGVLFAAEALALVEDALPQAAYAPLLAWAAGLPSDVFEIKRMRSQALPHLARGAVRHGLVASCRARSGGPMPSAAAASMMVVWQRTPLAEAMAAEESPIDGETFFWLVWSARLLRRGFVVEGHGSTAHHHASPTAAATASPQLRRFADPTAGVRWWAAGGAAAAQRRAHPDAAAEHGGDFWWLCARLAYSAYFPGPGAAGPASPLGSPLRAGGGARAVIAELLQWVDDERAPGVLCRVLPDAIPHCVDALPELVECVARLIERDSLIDVKVAQNLLEGLRRLAMLLHQALQLRADGGGDASPPITAVSGVVSPGKASSAPALLSPSTQATTHSDSAESTMSFVATPVVLNTLTESTRAAWGTALRPAVTVTLLVDRTGGGLGPRSGSSWTVHTSPSPTKGEASPTPGDDHCDTTHVVHSVQDLDADCLTTALHAVVGVCCSILARTGADASICKAALKVLIDGRIADCRAQLLDSLATRIRDEGYLVRDGALVREGGGGGAAMHDWDMSSDEEDDGDAGGGDGGDGVVDSFLAKWAGELRVCYGMQDAAAVVGAGATHAGLAAWIETLPGGL